MRLYVKMGLALLAGAALSFVLVVYVALDVFDRELDTVKASHFGFTVDEIAHAITVRTDLGLRLETIPEIASLLDLTQAADPGIDRLLVFDAGGRVVFSTDQTDLGTIVETGDRDQRWIETDDRAMAVGSPLINNFGKVVGGVLLESEVRHSAPLRERAVVTTLGIAAGAFAVCLLLVILLCRWTLDSLLALLGGSDASLLAMAEGRTADLEGAPPSLASFHETTTGMLDAMNADAREIDRLDRIG
ncbi:MAG: hypothetical protein OXF26_02260 [Alphaproteobacteria bacterium]|nr:hypothetical protein [Alphaproteobacteria bacterium]MCY4229710.1 hypothetical protein [Alphaproteobacteria bacterium]MCY4320223.1 hypothetical protein [Alphaproteobacteria bacterium]